MDADLYALYGMAMDRIEARDKLLDIEVQSIPMTSDKSARKKIIDKYKDVAYPVETRATVSTEEMVRMLKHGG